MALLVLLRVVTVVSFEGFLTIKNPMQAWAMFIRYLCTDAL